MTFAPRSGARRIGATAALAAAVLTATAGCGYIHQQPTTFHYDASDGVSANVGDIRVRNIMVVTNDAESEGRLLGTVLNGADREATVTVDTGKATARIEVPANSEVHLEDDETLVDPAGVLPGKMLEGTKISVGGQSTTTDVPVLNGALDEYRQYIPGGSDYTPPAKPTESHGH